jgi:Tfp pilus assembly protein PilN
MSLNTASFLPEDYLAQKAERRTNLISLTLFAVVMAAVFGAFLVTNRQWTQVRRRQQEINEQYQQAALRIEELNKLQEQKEQMLSKAELAASLVERVPRSILLAELINRMPPRLSLLSFEMESEKITAKAQPAGGKEATGKLSAPARPKTKGEAGEEARKPEPPRFKVAIAMTGVAPTDLEVSRYMSLLNGYALLRDVTLEYSEEKEIEGAKMRQFKIKMALNPEADVRSVEPILMPRGIPNPMSDEIRLLPPPRGTNTASAEPTGEGSD